MSTEIKCFTCNYRSIRMNICYTVFCVPSFEFSVSLFFRPLHVLPLLPWNIPVYKLEKQTEIHTDTRAKAIVCLVWLSVHWINQKFSSQLRLFIDSFSKANFFEFHWSGFSNAPLFTLIYTQQQTTIAHTPRRRRKKKTKEKHQLVPHATITSRNEQSNSEYPSNGRGKTHQNTSKMYLVMFVYLLGLRLTSLSYFYNRKWHNHLFIISTEFFYPTAR